MKAVVFHGNEDIRYEDVPEPTICHPRDALVRVTTAAICASDIHMRHHGDEMRVMRGTVLGHEFVGIIEEVGEGISNFLPGDRVAASCIFYCGECFYCQQGLISQCSNGASFGGMGDGSNNGAHAERVRVPYADSTMYKIPNTLSDEDVLFVGDILSTGFFGAERGGVKEGDTVVVFGAGPVGMCAMIAARIYGAAQVIAVNRNPHRKKVILEQKLADNIVNPLIEKPTRAIKELTQGRGADVIIDAVGGNSFSTVFDLVRRGGTVSLIGVYNEEVQFPIFKYWWRNLTVKMGLVETHHIPWLIDLIKKDQINTNFLITHLLPLNDIIKGYEIAEDRSYNALKVVIKNHLH